MMASQLGELDEKAFLSNSDAHSLSKMAENIIYLKWKKQITKKY